MRWRDPLTLIALGLSAVALWHLGNRAGKAEALAEARRDSIEATFAVNDSLLLELDAERRRLHVATTERDSAYQARRTVYRERVDTLTITDTVEVRAALIACGDAVSACDSVVASQRAELVVQDTLIRQLRAEVPRLRDLWREAESKTHDRPWGIGATCGAILSNLGAGYGCAAGITYRVRLPF